MNKVKIFVTPDEKEINDRVVAVIAEDGNLFQRAGELVRVNQYEEDGKMCPRIEALPDPSLRELISERILFQGDRGNIHPPDWCVRGIAARGNWPEVRILRNAIEYPILRADGTVLQKKGHDPITHLLYAPSCDYDSVPAQPTIEQVEAARDRLLELVCDFPFAAPMHRSAWLAGMLTLFARHSYDGPSPFLLVDGNVRGAGKSMLVDVASLIALGRRAPRTTQVMEENEEMKRITAVARAGESLMLIDNISRPFGNGAFDAALTSTTWKDRLLGQTEIRSFPLFTIWWATGNNVQFRAGADTARRTLHIRLLSPEQNPEKRTQFKFPNLIEHVIAHRKSLACDALTLLRGYRAYLERGGEPPSVRKLGSFEGWAATVAATVVWSGLPDPIEAHEHLTELADSSRRTLSDLLFGWQELCNAKGVKGLATREALQFLAEDDESRRSGFTKKEQFSQLRNALAELLEKHNPKALGRLIGSYREVVMDGWCFDTLEDESNHRKGQVWTVREKRIGKTEA